MDNHFDLDRNNIRKAAQCIRRACDRIPGETVGNALLQEALKRLAMVCDINRPIKKEVIVKGGLRSPNEVYRDAAKLLKKELKK